MAALVFIDGEAGTTGLQIRDRLAKRDDITLLSIDPALRKDPAAREAIYARADVAILCLPDDAAKESAALAAGKSVRVIDASTAHRVDADWTYGFAELSADQRARIAGAKLVSNPGCWATAAIGLLAPLVSAGLIARDQGVTINGVSGYTGGGKAMIADFEAGMAGAFFAYGLDHKQKHIPEIMAHTGIARTPLFIPSVGNYAQGILLQIPLHLGAGQKAADYDAALRDHYAGARFVRVVAPETVMPRANPERLNGTNMMELTVHASADGGRVVLQATLDNLGKGASGAAVQNLNIMLGLDEGLGL